METARAFTHPVPLSAQQRELFTLDEREIPSGPCVNDDLTLHRNGE